MKKVNSINCRERHTQREGCSLSEELPHPLACPAPLGCRGTKGRRKRNPQKVAAALVLRSGGFAEAAGEVWWPGKCPLLVTHCRPDARGEPCSSPSSCTDLAAVRRAEFSWIKREPLT